MKGVNKLLFVLLLIFMISCAKDSNDIVGAKENNFNLSVAITLFATITDPNALPSEETIEQVRVVVVAVGGSLQSGRVTCNQLLKKADLTGGNVAQVLARSGLSDVYLIVNETKELSGLANVNDVQTAIASFSEKPAVGLSLIPMVQCYKNINIPIYPNTVEVGNTSGALKMERLWAKVNIKFKATSEAGYPNLSGMKINSVELHNVPTYSYLISQPYLFTKDPVRPVDAKITKNYTLALTVNTDYLYQFYVPEFIGANAITHSFMMVNVTNLNGVSYTYKLPLGESVKDGNYNILRNSFYDITATIRGGGDISVKTIVQPWVKVSSTPVVGSYLTHDKTQHQDGTPLPEGGNIKEQGETIKVYCKTNVGGWYAVAQDKYGRLISRSAPAAAPDPLTQSQFVTLALPLADCDKQQYTVSLFQSKESDETVFPVRKLIYTHIPGLLPNSVLNGWPTTSDRPHGIQVAKIGNVYPWEDSLVTEPTSSFGQLTTVLSTDVGRGKSNSEFLRANFSLYPVIQPCIKLGAEWYIPSYSEFDLIRKNANLIGDKYLSVSQYYFVASTINPLFGESLKVWKMRIEGSGTASGEPMNTSAAVRCVRNI